MLRVGLMGPVLRKLVLEPIVLNGESPMPHITPSHITPMSHITITTVVVAVVVVLLIVAAITVCLVRRLVRMSRICQSRTCICSSPEAGLDTRLAYGLVSNQNQPTRQTPARHSSQEQGAWQWCMAFIPTDTRDGSSAMPPWWAPPPPWDAGAEQVSREAEALLSTLSETSLEPVVTLRSKAG
ncbi:MAG: hypothetical protein F4138_01905 [Acidimicrobiia bacterium]|nr:hypothetical protein [Acidimicrobiia bacterium]MYC57441.1 hypothetical protein [Acidimicrobiia bacterium]MYG93738.1 hypothetical protein [Acidimicrobiia bacterium]MYI30662.1 hypothetical protein [Acidimicrobiia bacterium]